MRVIAVLMAANACGGGEGQPTQPTAASVSTITLAPAQHTLDVAATITLVATLRDAAGATLSNRPVVWSSSAPTVASVDPSSGFVTGLAVGAATISAEAEGHRGVATIVVEARVPATLTLSPASGVLARGADYTFGKTVADARGQPMTGIAVEFRSSNPAIATVSALGVVHPVANGTVDISATVAGLPPASSRVVVTDPRTVSGQVFTADGLSPANLAFTVRVGTGAALQRFVANVDAASGTFSVVIPTFSASVSEVEYYVDVTAGLTRTYHPAYQKLAAGFAPSAARILVIPHYVTPDAGGYAGRRTPVSLNEAFIPVCANTGDENCQSYWPSYFVTGIKRWPDAARPIPLAIDRTTGTVSAADSAALWTAIRNMELDLGRSLYKAVNFTGYTSAGYTAGAVLASYDPTLTGFGAYTNWSWDGGGNIYQAKVRFSPSSRFSSGGLMTHELNHTLGFHHTCRWATVMGGYGCAQQARLSETDVAYYHLAELVARATGTVRPTWGIVESMAGERLFELGVVSAASVTISSAAHRSRLGQSGEDGAP